MIMPSLVWPAQKVVNSSFEKSLKIKIEVAY